MEKAEKSRRLRQETEEICEERKGVGKGGWYQHISGDYTDQGEGEQQGVQRP